MRTRDKAGGTGRRRPRELLAGVVAVAVASAGLSVVGAAPAGAAEPEMSVEPMPVNAVPLERAGEVTVWGDDGYDQTTVPAELDGDAVTQVVTTTNGVLALTAAGTVVGWGGTAGRLHRIPEEVAAAEVRQIAAANGQYAAAVTRSGRVLTWGIPRDYPTALDVPAGLTGVAQVAMSTRFGVALKEDGSVVAWGGDPSPTYGAGRIKDVPAELRVPGAATAVVAGDVTAYALTTDGTVVAWGPTQLDSPSLDLPESVTESGNVKAVAATNTGGLVILADDTLDGWNLRFGPLAPESVLNATPVSIDGGRRLLGMVGQDGVIHHWKASGSYQEPVPEALQGAALAQFDVFDDSGAAVTTKMLRADSPVVAGRARVGSTLTATPGTFSAAPDTVSGQWLANGDPIMGATESTLRVTRALVGKRISYRSTAVKSGEETISSRSTATGRVAAPAPVKVRSKTKIKKVKAARKARKVKVVAKVRAARSPQGKAKMVIKKGKKTIVKKKVRVNRKGKIKSVIKKFRKRVLRKARNWRGKYKVKIKYLGNKRVKPSKGAKKFKIKR